MTIGRESRAAEGAWARRTWTWAVAPLKRIYHAVKRRYGPGYTHAMWIVTLMALFVPFPGITVLGIALVAATAEAHRAISKGSKLYPSIGKETSIMSINCEVILNDHATAGQLATLGSALWRWCGRAVGETGIYPRLDNQVLADLIAGKKPPSGQTPRQSDHQVDGIHFRMQDAGSHDRQATIDRLRSELPQDGIRD
ncbi:MAG: hypothetical protein ACJ8F7_20015, partial [Gemmataceae bacterium]